MQLRRRGYRTCYWHPPRPAAACLGKNQQSPAFPLARFTVLARLGHTVGLVKKGARCVTNLGCFALFACLVFLLHSSTCRVHKYMGPQPRMLQLPRPSHKWPILAMYSTNMWYIYIYLELLFHSHGHPARVVGIESNPARGTG